MGVATIFTIAHLYEVEVAGFVITVEALHNGWSRWGTEGIWIAFLCADKVAVGGYEQSRSDYTTDASGAISNYRAYKFSKNVKKYYAFGTNGLLNIAYKF